MMIKPQLCPVCRTTLPEQSTRRKIYCSDNCRHKAKWRRSKNIPIADLPATTEELANLTQDLTIANGTIRKLQKQLAKATAKTAATQSELQTAITMLQSLENSSATHIAQAYQIAQQENLQLQTLNEQLASQLSQLQKQLADLPQLQEDAAGAERFAKNLQATYRQLYDRWFNQAIRINTISRDALFYAAYYYRATDRAGWSHEDYERHKRFESLKANPPARPTRRKESNTQ